MSNVRFMVAVSEVPNTCRSSIPSGWPRRASSLPLGVSATLTTMRSPSRLVQLSTASGTHIGNIPPAEAEERYYVMLDEPAMAA